MNQYIIYTDGASRGNPGHSSAGFVIQSPNGLMWAQEAVYLGLGTNNQAEYKAVVLALEKLDQDFSAKLPAKIEVRADSLLVVQQLSGKYKLKSAILKPLFESIKVLEKRVGQVVYRHIPREQNSLADKLANLALDRHFGF